MKTPLARLVVLLLIALSATAANGESPSQVVVLRNGNVLEGQVDQLGDFYRIVTATSEIRLPARDVERITPTIHDAYAAKRALVRENSLVDHLQLATWCSRQELWTQAEDELRAAQVINPRHPEIELMARRMQVASEAAMRVARPTMPAHTDSQSEVHKAEVAALESFAATVPPKSLETFARQMQPILVNGCSAGGCHSTTDAQQFKLNRDLLHGVANRESTLRNLQAVWNMIDHNNPEQSLLLTKPAASHGGLMRPVFAGHRQQVHETLAAWVRDTTPRSAKQQPTIELAAHIEVPSPEATPPQPGEGDIETGEDEKHFWEDEAAMEEGHAPPGTLRHGAAVKKFAPRDEFDPEVFNRQKKTPPASEPQQ